MERRAAEDKMQNVLGLNERRVRHTLGVIYKALIIGTLGSLFVFAPLKEGRARTTATEHVAMAPIQEVPEKDGLQKVLWLDSNWTSKGQGDGLSLAFEE